MTPCLLQNNIMRHEEGLGDFVTAMAKRFRLVRYDGRGTGNSTRGVRPNTTLADLRRDLLAVVEELRLDRFVLYGDVYSSYMLLDAACMLRNAVRALILVNPVPLNGAPFMPQWEQLYTNSWDQFINLFASTYGANIRGSWTTKTSCVWRSVRGVTASRTYSGM
jgi:pimeloyl-ACP methyl ester carboxylesterase